MGLPPMLPCYPRAPRSTVVFASSSWGTRVWTPRVGPLVASAVARGNRWPPFVRRVHGRIPVSCFGVSIRSRPRLVNVFRNAFFSHACAGGLRAPARPDDEGRRNESLRDGRRPADVWVAGGTGRTPWQSTSPSSVGCGRTACRSAPATKRSREPIWTSAACGEAGLVSHLGEFGPTACRAISNVAAAVAVRERSEVEAAEATIARSMSCSVHRKNAGPVPRRFGGFFSFFVFSSLRVGATAPFGYSVFGGIRCAMVHIQHASGFRGIHLAHVFWGFGGAALHWARPPQATNAHARATLGQPPAVGNETTHRPPIENCIVVWPICRHCSDGQAAGQ